MRRWHCYFTWNTPWLPVCVCVYIKKHFFKRIFQVFEINFFFIPCFLRSHFLNAYQLQSLHETMVCFTITTTKISVEPFVDWDEMISELSDSTDDTIVKSDKNRKVLFIALLFSSFCFVSLLSCIVQINIT